MKPNESQEGHKMSTAKSLEMFSGAVKLRISKRHPVLEWLGEGNLKVGFESFLKMFNLLSPQRLTSLLCSYTASE